jgi:hypothetical protein
LHIGWTPVVNNEKMDRDLEERLKQGKRDLLREAQTACGKHCHVVCGETAFEGSVEARAKHCELVSGRRKERLK